MRVEYSKATDGTTVERWYAETEEDRRVLDDRIRRGEIEAPLSLGDVIESIPEEEFVGDWSEEERAKMAKDSK